MKKNGFTLVEVLVGAAVFVVIALASYNAYVALFKLINLNQYRVMAINLANEQFEIARNMPYSSVGVQGSIPNGAIPYSQTVIRGGTTFTVTTIVRNIDLPFDGTIGGTPNDLSPADNKLVEVTVSCANCQNTQPVTLTGQVSPKNLETASTNGALFIRVFDANGQPVQNASVQVINVATTTNITINDVTDSNGMLQLVDIPPQNNAYRITVTKNGYSTDRTYPVTQDNLNPTKPDATVLLQQVTQLSFAIDKLSSVHFSTVTPTCEIANNFSFNFKGAKTIGLNIPKYSLNTQTNSAGTLDLSSVEWDSYTVTPTDSSKYLAGLNPLNPVSINPDGSQNIQMVIVSKIANGLLVTVKDRATSLPLSGALVKISSSTTGFSQTYTTGRGFLTQTDWSGGSGQENFINASKYYSDDGNVDVSTSSGQILLKNSFGTYSPNGTLVSSIFDTGSASNFYSLIWSPVDQPILTGINSVKMQFASNASNTPETIWEFKGPDGTLGSFYTTSNSSINSVHNNQRYARYKLFMSTESATTTPNVSDISFTYTSNCVPSGQVIFTGVTAGRYDIEVSKDGYATYSDEVVVSSGWKEFELLMNP